jgi:hypothetical protein
MFPAPPRMRPQEVALRQFPHTRTPQRDRADDEDLHPPQKAGFVLTDFFRATYSKIANFRWLDVPTMAQPGFD